MERSFQPEAITTFMTIGIALMLLMALSLVLFFLFSQQKFNRVRYEAQATELLHQQQLSQRNLLVQEEERQRIAAQLHDDLGSKLGVISLSLHRLRRAEGQQPLSDALLTEINDLVAATLQSTRRLSHELLPPTLEEFGLVEALREFFEGLQKATSIDFLFENTLAKTDLADPIVELNLFRIVQELTNNSLKHAHATQISLFLGTENGQKTLRYRDNGIGMDLENQPMRGLGLRNLRQRVQIISGTYDLRTAPGKGVEVQVFF
jgi:signal transduction histidine kinase